MVAMQMGDKNPPNLADFYITAQNLVLGCFATVK
jgi:hypothetical protein